MLLAVINNYPLKRGRAPFCYSFSNYNYIRYTFGNKAFYITVTFLAIIDTKCMLVAKTVVYQFTRLVLQFTVLTNKDNE